MELEFVQCLANPHYINWLAQNRHFDDPRFVNYLSYLQYWRSPEYARYLRFPHCLYMLDLLQHKEFRKAMSRTDAAEHIHRQQFFFWKYHRANKDKPHGPAEGTANVKTEAVEVTSEGLQEMQT